MGELNCGRMDPPEKNCNHLGTNHTVLVQNLNKSYGKAQVLQNVSMHVEEGTIYGLLGSSGCGKTTLCSCLCNLKSWDSGDIFIFGKRVNKGKAIEAGDIGYMPQDTSLYEQLTVMEMLKYFSELYGMSQAQLDKTVKFLEDLVNLPGFRHRRITTLSGGQKRRISLSLTLVHGPKLLILDEPTVGLDPLLRESLWKYLYNLTIANKTTLIITTHYIEEVKQAHRIGIMRKGRLLVEDNPASLMRAQQTVILEDVVRKICYKDADNQSKNLRMNNGSSAKTNENDCIPSNSNSVNLFRICCNEESSPGKEGGNDFKKFPNLESRNNADNELVQVQTTNNGSLCNNDINKKPQTGILNSLRRSLAYSKVVGINFYRHPMFVFIIIFLPPFQLLSTATVFGVEPKNTPIGIVNLENPYWINNCTENDLIGSSSNYSADHECNLDMLSCYFLKHLLMGPIIKPVQFLTKQDAFQAVERGDIGGYIQIPDNFSQHIIMRALAIQFATEETINGTTIVMDLDLTEFIKMYTVTTHMFKSFVNFIKELTSLCSFDLRLIDVPFFYRHPVYGVFEGTAQDYALPALFAGLLFEISFCITPLVFVNDIKYGTMERSKVAGLRFSEFMTGLMVTTMSVSVLQGVICYIAMEYGLDFRMNGSTILYLFLCLVACLCGGTFGLFMGIFFKDEMTIIISAIFILPILMLYVGILRPEEIIPLPLRTIVYYFFPSAAIVKSFRFVINRGLGILHPQVWPGILITSLWAGVFSLLSLITIKRYKS